MPNQIPLDPHLRKDFDTTPNDERTKAELDAWWDHPYGVTRPDGSIDVRCLNGGAWDRSTWLGNAADYDAACALAAEKQSAWVSTRAAPVLYLDSPKCAVIRMPQRPDQSMARLVEVDTTEEAAAYMKEHYPTAHQSLQSAVAGTVRPAHND